MSGIRDRIKALEKKDGGPDLPRMVLLARADGTYVQQGSGEVFTQADVDRLGDLAQVVFLRVVYAGYGDSANDNGEG